MTNLLTGNLKKEHYRLKANSNKNNKKNNDKCCVGDYDNKMKLTNKWSLKK